MVSLSSHVDDLALSATEKSTVNPNETRTPLVVGVTTTALFLATLVTVLRVYVRGFLLKKWGADDTALVASYVRARSIEEKLEDSLLMRCSGSRVSDWASDAH